MLSILWFPSGDDPCPIPDEILEFTNPPPWIGHHNGIGQLLQSIEEYLQ